MEKRILTIDELAQYLGFAKGTIYNWVYLKKIPYVKLGGRVKFDIRDIDQMIERLKIEPNRDTAI